MVELDLAVYTGGDGGHKVTMNAKFATHEEAVHFMKDVSRLCEDHSASVKKVRNLWLWSTRGARIENRGMVA